MVCLGIRFRTDRLSDTGTGYCVSQPASCESIYRIVKVIQATQTYKYSSTRAAHNFLVYFIVAGIMKGKLSRCSFIKDSETDSNSESETDPKTSFIYPTKWNRSRHVLRAIAFTLSYLYCRCGIANPSFFKRRFLIQISSFNFKCDLSAFTNLSYFAAFILK